MREPEGFVQAWVPWPQDYCAHYDCDEFRADYRRWCIYHCRERDVEIYSQGGGTLLKFEVP